jgi:TolB-like protein
MELVEGETLDRMLVPGGLPLARVIGLGVELADALAAAHEKGVVHRDLKPANVMVARDGRVRMLDFGLAKLSMPDPGDGNSGNTTISSPLSHHGQVLGTVPYMAPEQIRGEAVDFKSDLFALGVVLYELAVGTRPFTGASRADVGSAILRDAPIPPTRIRAGLPAEFDRIVERCMAKAPRDRYASALELRADLRALEESLERGERTPTARRAGPLPIARPLAWMVAAILVAALATMGWFALRRAQLGSEAAATGKRSVAVLPFDNVTGEPALDWMKRGVAELLSAALVQSSRLDVFDAERLGDLAAAAARGGTPAPASRAFLLAHGIRRVITGTILRSGGTLRLEGQIVDTSDGRVLSAYSVEGPADSDLFRLVGRLLPQLQVALEVNLAGDREAEGWLREITTGTVEAYRLYLRGHEALIASHWKEAALAYEQALAIDSTFVAARAELSGAYWNLGDEARLSLTRAAMNRLRGRADVRGRLRIDLLNAVVGNDPEALVRSASALVQLYPENRFYTYLLGRGYYTSKQYARCLETLRPLMVQRYNWAWTYVLSAHSAERLADTTTARNAFEEGFQVTHADPELAYAYVKFLQRSGRPERVRAVIDRALGSPTIGETPIGEGELRLELARDLVAHGDRSRARTELRRALGLLPANDEARLAADSLVRQIGTRGPSERGG